ncbi:hypothetical protein DXZ79_02075 [Yersinia rochesterensis]|uniref:Uncharacterized protein n=1 Tax=Yersinia rochesterensis TaxID=1604335 RepID=A0A8D4N3H3_9GAMM|nr:hypothetical protein DXZ79_02075 [Yersinia rochesterensis]
MKILSYNPGHDGAFAYIEDGRLVFSIEAEKSSKYRHSLLSVPDVFDTLAELHAAPDVLCKGGWWPGDSPRGGDRVAEYRGSDHDRVIVSKKRLLGKTIDFFSSSHERSHLLCAFGMSILVATRHNPVIKEFDTRRIAAGKTKKVALTACIQKLVTIQNAMLKKNEAWDPLYHRHAS